MWVTLLLFFPAILGTPALLNRYSAEPDDISIRPDSLLSVEDEELLRRIADEGVAVTTLDRLAIESTDTFAEAVPSRRSRPIPRPRPVNLDLCRNAAFRKAVPLMVDRLTTRQRSSIFELDELLN